MRVMAEGLSRLGVPVFMADVKGDLAGLCRNGEDGRLSARAHDRILKVARTIADFEDKPDIDTAALTEALGYRDVTRGEAAVAA